MRTFATTCLSVLVLMLASITLTGCDETPGTVNDIAIQPDLSFPSSIAVIILDDGTGQTEFTLEYQGLDEPPSLESSNADLVLERLSQSGTPETGEQRWRASYNQVPDDILDETLTLSTTANGQSLTRSIAALIAEIQITTDFTPSFANVIDYEDEVRSIETAGGATAEIVENASPNSSGINSLQFDAVSGGSVTISNETNGVGADRLTFLVFPDAGSTVPLEIRVVERVDGGQEARTLTIPITPGSEWRKYGIEFDKFSEVIDPVSSASGGSGSLLSVQFTSGGTGTVFLDEIALGTETENVAEIHNFDSTSNAYGSFSDIEFGTSNNVADVADGITSRTLSYTTGGNFFGYNYNTLRADLTVSDVLSLNVGEVSRDFVLFAFVESQDDSGGYTFNGGVEVDISASDGWEQVTIPLSQLGSDPSVLLNPGMRNVGFEVRRAPGDESTEPIEFLLDDIQLRPAN